VVVLVPSTTKVVVLVAKLEVRILSLAGAGQQERGRGVRVDCSVRGGGRKELRERGRESARETEQERKRWKERDGEREKEGERTAQVTCFIVYTTWKTYTHTMK
jgi:hypothetical protein